MSGHLTIKKITRTTKDGVKEFLEFTSGVNVLEGNPNAGKTVWMNMIDFLLGDTSPVEEAIGNEDSQAQKLFDKYVSIEGIIQIDDKEIILERRWQEPGLKSKIFIDGQSVSNQDFSDSILTKLNVPILHFPKGNPYAERAWPSLSWRMLMRHIFRQERFWSDIADKQPEIEQHAVLAQFLGVADKLFSQGLGEIIEKRKKLMKLEAEREQFSSILDNIAKSMSGNKDQISFATTESITNEIEALERKIAALLNQREQTIERGLDYIDKNNGTENLRVAETSEQHSKIINDLEILSKKKQTLIQRIEDFKVTQNTINQELSKLERTKLAGNLFADLKVTHCPACDQEIQKSANQNADSCFLCHREISHNHGENRIEFEMNQLQAESDELVELINSLNKELENYAVQESSCRDAMNTLQREIAPLKQKLSVFVNPELEKFDSERGRLEEQIENFKRILKNLDYKTELIKRIDALTTEMSSLESQLDNVEGQINYEEVSGLLEDQIANYLSELNKTNPNAWPQQRVRFKFRERDFSFKVNEAKWEKALGGTSKLFFIFAYHYSLLALSRDKKFNYPGFLMLDFPPEFLEAKDITDKENYLLEPFITLCDKSPVPLQVIIAGRSFKGLENVNSIELSTIWK